MPDGYSTTPGGTLYATTPGGQRGAPASACVFGGGEVGEKRGFNSQAGPTAGCSFWGWKVFAVKAQFPETPK